MKNSRRFNELHGISRVLLLGLLAAIMLASCVAETPAPPENKVSPYIAGKVVLPEGAGVKLEDIGISVTADDAPVANLNASSDGSFSVSGLDPEKTYSIIFSSESIGTPAGRSARAAASSDGFGGWLSNIVPSTAEGTSIGNIKMKPLGTIRGKVGIIGYVDESVTTTIYIPGTSYMAIADENGEFAIFNVPQGFHDIRIVRPGYTPIDIPGVSLNNNSYSEHPVTALPDSSLTTNLGSVSGKVRLPGTRNCTGVTASLEGQGLSDVTKEDGSYEIIGIKPGSYSLVFTFQGHASLRKDVEVTAAQQTFVEDVFMKKEMGILSGSIVLEGESTHEGVNILLKSVDGMSDCSFSTSLDGSFKKNDIVPGVYQLIASRNGFKSVKMNDIEITSAAEKKLDPITLNVGRSFMNGTATLEGATDHSGISITATCISNPDEIYYASTNSEGRYSLAGMSAGEYLVEVGRKGYKTAKLDIVDFQNENLMELTPVELKVATGTIKGRIELPGRTDNSGVAVKLLGTDYATETEESGIFNLPVPEGNYLYGLSFEHPYHEAGEYQPEGGNIVIFENDVYALKSDISLIPTCVDVKGSVSIVNAVYDAADPIRVVLSKDGTEHTVDVGEDGSFSFSMLPLGNYSMTVRYSRMQDYALAPVDLKPCDVMDLGSFEITPPTGSFMGTATTDYPEYFKSSILVEVFAAEDHSTPIGSCNVYKDHYSFNIPDIPTTGKYDVHFQAMESLGDEYWIYGVDAPRPLQIVNITPEPVVLKDKVRPQVNNILFNGGVNYINQEDVVINFRVEDSGSGIDRIEYGWDLEPRNTSWGDYEDRNERTRFPNPTENSRCTLKYTVYDKSGNSVSGEIEVTYTYHMDADDLVGILTDDFLHWTEAGGPYRVIGNVTIPEGKTLVIDPGVKVFFGYDGVIIGEGNIHAVGTPDKRIVFKEDENSYNRMQPMIRCNAAGTEVDHNNGDWISGNRFDYVDIIGERCISGNFHMDHSKIDAYSAAISSVGDDSIASMLVRRSSIVGSCSFGNGRASDICIVYDTEFRKGSSYSFTSLTINNADFVGNRVWGYHVDGKQKADRMSSDSRKYLLESNSFDACRISLGLDDVYARYNEFKNMEFSMSISGNGSLSMCNFADNDELSELFSRYGDGCVDMTYNYWGARNTAKLDAGDTSFLGSSKIDASNYERAPYDCTMSPSSFLKFDIELARYSNVGEPVVAYLKPSSSTITEYRYAESMEDLYMSDWVPYDAFLEFNISESTSEDGWTTLYVQGQNADAVSTPVAVLNFPYAKPVIKSFVVGDILLYSDSWCKEFKVYSPYENEMDPFKVVEYIDGAEVTYHRTLPNGTYTAYIEYTDIMGNMVRTEEKTFNVNVPEENHVNYVTYDSSEGEYLIEGWTSTPAISAKLYDGNHMIYEYRLDKSPWVSSFRIHVPWQSMPSDPKELRLEFYEYGDSCFGDCTFQFEGTGTERPDSFPEITIKEDSGRSPRYSVSMVDKRGIRKYRILLDERILYDESHEIFTSQWDERCTVDIRNMDLIPGNHVIKVEAMNNQGYTSVKEFNIQVESLNPTLTLTKSSNPGEYTWYVTSEDTDFTDKPILYVDGIGFGWLCSVCSIPEKALPDGPHIMVAGAATADGNMVWSNSLTEDGGPVDPTDIFGLNITWNSDGSFIADSATDILFNFDDPEKPFVEEVSGKVYRMDYFQHEQNAGIGNGSLLGTSVKDHKLDLKLDTLGMWTVEFVSTGNISLDFNEWGKMSDGFSYGDFKDWEYTAFVCRGDSIDLYVNGVWKESTIINPGDYDKFTGMILNMQNAGLDNLRVSSKARSREEIFGYAKYLKQNDLIREIQEVMI